MRKVKVVKG